MTVPRARLPYRHPAETFELEIGGLHYTCTVGRFPDGSVGEVFLQNHKPGSQSDFNARDSAIVCSLALQHGVALWAIRRALLRDSRGNASTPLAAALDRMRRSSHEAPRHLARRWRADARSAPAQAPPTSSHTVSVEQSSLPWAKARPAPEL